MPKRSFDRVARDSRSVLHLSNLVSVRDLYQKVFLAPMTTSAFEVVVDSHHDSLVFGRSMV